MTAQKKAVFLDRDGVLIHDVHYLSRLEDIKFYPDVAEGLRRLKAAGYQLVVVTNQSGVSRGFFPESFVIDCHNELNRTLAVHQAQLDHLYFCPHHIDGNPPLNVHCNCRKPAPGMINRAQRELDLDLSQAFMIGDKLSDVEMAVNADVRGILLTTGQGKDAVGPVSVKYPDIPVFTDFTDAVDFILSFPETPKTG